MAVQSNFSKKSKASYSLSYTLRPEAKDADMVKAQIQIDDHFNPAKPEICFGYMMDKPSQS